jgi:hypothetical protein
MDLQRIYNNPFLQPIIKGNPYRNPRTHIGFTMDLQYSTPIPRIINISIAISRKPTII